MMVDRMGCLVILAGLLVSLGLLVLAIHGILSLIF